MQYDGDRGEMDGVMFSAAATRVLRTSKSTKSKVGCRTDDNLKSERLGVHLLLIEFY
jgi:hypothetical protein